MSRKSIILSLIAVAVMLVGIGVAVLFLYSDVEMPSGSRKSHVADDERHALLSAVPSDAVLASCLSDVRKAAPEIISGLELPEAMRKSEMAVSLHYAGKLQPLFVFKAPADEAVASDFAGRLRAKGMTVEQTEYGMLIASESEGLVKSSLRHIGKKVSVLDASGFEEALASVPGDDFAIISNAHINRLVPAVMTRKFLKYSDFLTRLADWTAFGISTSDTGLSLQGSAVFDDDATDFMTVLQKSAPSSSSVSSVLPSHTLFALTLPMRDIEPYISAYQGYMDTRQRLQANISARDALKRKYKADPQEIMTRLDVREVATARLMTGRRLDTITLVKVGSRDAHVVDTVAYSEIIPALFGNFFTCASDAESVFMNGWIISGRKEVIDGYRSGKALEYSLKNYMSDAGLSDISPSKAAAAVAYFSFTEEPAVLSGIFTSSFLRGFRRFHEGADTFPAVLSVVHGKEGMILDFSFRRLSLKKTEAALFERDTTVIIPKGPFRVRNSGTGKMNEFYQNSHLSLCLREEGKDLWGVTFDRPICGTAQTVDFFANGKLQILFGAGSRLYLIDRLGRYVSGFPVDLKKDILLGPDVYDFNGKRKYNVMVLHKDNTIEMYNLQGVKPASWKGIGVSGETIKSLPERIDLGGSTFWVVRTSVQTLIFPFYGGGPLTVYAGNQRIRPDSPVKVLDGNTVEFTCYDGKVRTQTLK